MREIFVLKKATKNRTINNSKYRRSSIKFLSLDSFKYGMFILYLWSKNKNFHSRLCLDVNSLFTESTRTISRISCGWCNRPVPTNTSLGPKSSESNSPGCKSTNIKIVKANGWCTLYEHHLKSHSCIKGLDYHFHGCQCQSLKLSDR